MKILFTLTLLIALSVTYVHSQSADEDQVEVAVPNYPHKFYSGYLDINLFENKSIHYVFFESQNDVSKDPLILWLSGGPGCSSLLTAFHENGPFIFYPGAHTFKLNKNAWNKYANLLYFELPAGVGFSTKDNMTQPITNEILVEQAVQALTTFFARFQKMKKNDLYLMGHEFSAVYVTHLAKQIINRNEDPFSIFNDKWNLKGLLMGNPCVKPDECYSSGSYRSSKYHYQFLYRRAFFSQKDYEKYQAQCEYKSDSYECYEQRTILDNKFNATNSSEFNIYDNCYRGNTSDTFGFENIGCEDDLGLLHYLNDQLVQQNWNIRPKQWQVCSRKVFDAYLSGKNSYYLLPDLIKKNLRIWVYSGDLDSKVPVSATKKWIKQLKDELQLPILKNWREWWVTGKHPGEDQVGGYTWEIEGLTFSTVKGAGLRAPLDKSQAMDILVNSFLKGQSLPYKQF